MRALLLAASAGFLAFLSVPVSAEDPIVSPAAQETNLPRWLDFKDIVTGGDVAFALKSVLLDGSQPIDDSVVEATLWVKCMDDKTMVLVDWKRYLGAGDSDNRVLVVYAFDDGEAIGNGTWRATSNLEGAGLQGKQAIAMARRLAEADRLQVLTGTPAGGTVAAIFKVGGFDQHLPKIQEACHWK